jgi:hypothetical protein
MAIDPNIALEYRGVELPNQLAQYGALAQIQGAQQANALRALQMRELEEGMARRNRLTAQLGAPEFASLKPEEQVGALTRGGFLTEARSLAESQAKVGKEQREEQKAMVDLAAANMKQQRDLLPAVKANPSIWGAWRADTIAKLPGLASIIPEQYTPQAADALMLQADKALEQHFTTQNLGGRQQVIAMPKYGAGAPAAVVPGSIAADVPLPADVEAQKVRIAQASRPPGTTVTLVQEKAELGARGKLLVSQYEDISKQASVAQRSLPAIDANLATLDKGFKTGFGTETIAAGAKVLAALGVQDAEKYATNAQTFLANANAAVLQRQLEQKGPQTESDAQRITQTGAQMGNTEAANKFVLNVARAQLKRDVDQRNFYDRWWKQNKTYDGAEDAWYAGEGGRSLFDRPELKAYVPRSQQIPGQGPVPARAPAPAVAPNIDALLNKYK